MRMDLHELNDLWQRLSQVTRGEDECDVGLPAYLRPCPARRGGDRYLVEPSKYHFRIGSAFRARLHSRDDTELRERAQPFAICTLSICQPVTVGFQWLRESDDSRDL
jgi:hypothetical protein